jgi:hypothetical protein
MLRPRRLFAPTEASVLNNSMSVIIDISKEITAAIPSISAGVVIEWEIDILYTNGTPSLSSYMTQEYIAIIPQKDFAIGGPCCWGLSAEGEWDNLDKLIHICPTIEWDLEFENNIHEAFDPPTPVVVANSDYVIPSS